MSTGLATISPDICSTVRTFPLFTLISTGTNAVEPRHVLQPIPKKQRALDTPVHLLFIRDSIADS